MCRDCRAHKKDPALLYSDIGETANWRNHPRSHAAYLASARDVVLPALVLIPGWNLALRRYDLMHVLFLGIGLHVVGSCIVQLAFVRYWPAPRSLAPQLRLAWVRFSERARLNGVSCSQPRFTAAQFNRSRGQIGYAEVNQV